MTLLCLLLRHQYYRHYDEAGEMRCARCGKHWVWDFNTHRYIEVKP